MCRCQGRPENTGREAGLCGRLRLRRGTTGLLAITKPLQHPPRGTAVWGVSAVTLVAMLTAAAAVTAELVAVVPMQVHQG